MRLDTPIRGFPSQDEARSVTLELDSQGIPCRVATDPAGVFATLFVAGVHSDRASEIVGEDGFDIAPVPESEAEQSTDAESDTSSAHLATQVAAELDAVTRTYAAGIWQRIRSRPCKILPATGLLLSYAFFILLGIGSAFLFEMTVFALTETRTEIVSRTSPSGNTVRLHGKKHFGPKSVIPFERVDAVAEFIHRNQCRPYCLVIATKEPHAPWGEVDYFRLFCQWNCMGLVSQRSWSRECCDSNP